MDSFTSGYPYLLLPTLSVLALWLLWEVWRAPVDDLQALANWQKAIADNASREEQERCFGRLMLDIMQTAHAVKASK